MVTFLINNWGRVGGRDVTYTIDNWSREVRKGVLKGAVGDIPNTCNKGILGDGGPVYKYYTMVLLY